MLKKPQVYIHYEFIIVMKCQSTNYIKKYVIHMNEKNSYEMTSKCI